MLDPKERFRKYSFISYSFFSSEIAFVFILPDHGPLRIFDSRDSFDSPFSYSFLTTARKRASNPNSKIAEATITATPRVIIPPIIPPGSRRANAAVIAAAPGRPVIEIATINIIPGTSSVTILSTTFSISLIFMGYYSV